MSTTGPAQPEQDTARSGTEPAGAEISPALRQDTRGRPQNFGLNVKRLRLVRVIVFAVLALPILVLGLLAIRFVSMPITQSMHHSAYQDGDYSTAIERLAPVQVANWFEPYLPHLSEGTDLLQQGENAAAEEELTVALQKWESAGDLNQPLHAMCKIRNNLAISIERQADEIEDPAERAERLYEAETIIAPCASGGGGGDGEGDGSNGGGGEGSEESEGEGQGQDEGEGGESQEEGEGGDQGQEDGENEGGGDEEGDDSSGGTGNEDQETTDGNDERIEEKRRESDEEAGNDPDAREDGEGEGGDGEDEGGDSPRDPGDPTRTDPDGEEPPQESPTSGEDPDQEKEDELEERNREAQEGGEGEDDPSGGDQEPSKPW